ncbi:hypothetical protein FUT69_01420 [Xylella taiwanensis]|uniref:Uncharacterized protein n=1 Tax=Xylella taiwanensis TaxID=1444770 RepID=Z9JKA2_9GAMM|nr:hypothetical protein [Xylella taiwanensis]AXI84209.1 hypothetical protein AB672_09805 [Xylella taiwanensis]EWS78845.1 hypothetical protein AF72_03015 [Xylella taiwanensis]MCD8457325.1 hypothetical protein [Xylella taiwanensis]MCD8459736.1 hypothetical protein [Xylella taiwanensis]MCD8461394.1 hypothetical protein [Xylella taiwanensis]
MSALVIDIRTARKLVQELHRIHRHDARAAGVKALVREIRDGGNGWNIINDVVRFRIQLERHQAPLGGAYDC